MSDEKRMAGDFHIIQSMFIGDKEVVIGENPSALPGHRYMCALGTHNALFNQFTDVLESDDYPAIVQIYTQRVTEQNEKVRAETERMEKQGIDLAPITTDGCQVITADDDLNGKVIVIKPDVLRQEYRVPTHQLKLCLGGFGASPHSRGSAVFCADLYSGQKARFERWDVLGVLEPEALPEWAKRGLATIQRQQSEKRTSQKNGKEVR